MLGRPWPAPAERSVVSMMSEIHVAVKGVHPENGDVDPKNGMGLLSSGSRRETVRWKAIAYSYPAH